MPYTLLELKIGDWIKYTDERNLHAALSGSIERK